MSIGTAAGLMPATSQTDANIDVIEFFIPGAPVQQGSKTGFSRLNSRTVQMTDQNKTRLKPWRATVADHADLGVTFDCPVYVELTFVMPRPKKPRWFVPAVKPDLDKLTRAVLDGLTDGGLLADDARVVRMLLEEEYAGENNPVGCHVAVMEYTK